MSDNTNADASARRTLPMAAPNGLIAAVLLAFLATAGLFYVNIMAAIVDGLVAGLGLTESQAGTVGSVNIYGAAAGALVAVFLVRRMPWKTMALVCLVILIAIDLVSITLADGFEPAGGPGHGDGFDGGLG